MSPISPRAFRTTNQAGNDTITVDVPEGEYVLYFFVKLNGYSRVILGAPGASGPW